MFITDDKYITSTQDGFVLKDLTMNKPVVLLDADTKVIIRYLCCN